MARRYRLMIEMPWLPKSWRRYPGSQRRYKPQDIRDWQEEIVGRVKEEMDIEDVQYPMDPVEIVIEVTVEDEKQLGKVGDPDNIEKPVFDALTGVAIKGDKMKNIPSHTTKARFGKHAGTRITITPLLNFSS